MVPADKDSDGSDFDESSGRRGEGRDDIIDLENDEGDSLSSDRFTGDMDIDITGDAGVDFADEAADPPPRSGLKKIVAPALVLAMAAGIGGYIVMNPDILGGGKVETTSVMAYTQADTASPQDQAPVDIASASPAGDTMFGDTLPQPTVNQNEMPRGPEGGVPSAGSSSPVPEPTPEISTVVDLTEVTEITESESADQPADIPLPVVDSIQTEAVAAETVTDNAIAEISAEPSAEPKLQEAAVEIPSIETVTDAIQSDDDAEIAADSAVPPPEAQPQIDVITAVLEAEQSTLLPTAAVEIAATENVSEPVPEEAVSEEIQEVADANPPLMPPSAPESGESALTTSDASSEQASSLTSSQSLSGSVAQPADPPSSPSPAADVYYDGRVTPGPLATEVGPRKVDPVTEPASQLVVVKKNYSATDFESLVASANRALKLKRYDAALEMFDQLYARNRRDQRVLMGRAVAQQNSGLTESAIMTYEELLAISPNDADAMVNMLGLIRKQYPEVALRRLKDMSAKFPNNAGVAAQLGVAHADLGHYAEAMRYLGIAATIQPNVAQHVYNMAIIADRNGDTQAAIRNYEKALETDAVHSGGRSIPRERVYDRLAALRRR